MKAEQEAARKNQGPSISKDDIRAAPEKVQVMWAEVASREYARRREAEVKTELVLSLAHQAKRDFEQAKSAPNPAHAEFMRREAERKVELAERLTSQFVGFAPSLPAPPSGSSAGNPVPTRPPAASQGASSQSPSRREKPKLQPIFVEWDNAQSRLQAAAVEADPRLIHDRAVRDFGEGRAGAGGIALYKAAEAVEGPAGRFDPRAITGVDFSAKHPALLLKDRRLLFPPVDLEYLALALRVVYCREGAVKGILTAEEPNAVVVQTGRQQFGEVVWKKEFLPGEWKSVAPGNTVEVELGPGLGLLNSPEPSVNRVTYYGPIKNTRMGRVLLEADQVMTTLMLGLDPHTGRPVALPKIDGFMTVLERQVRTKLAPKPEGPSKDSSAAAATAAPRKESWWTDVGWLVWVPDRFTFRVAADGKGLEFVENRLRLAVWSVNPAGAGAEFQQASEHVSQHYSEYMAAFPPLRDLEEVARAVTFVRWLKAQNVAVDLDWAKQFPVANVETPATTRRYECWWLWQSGKPLVEKGDAP